MIIQQLLAEAGFGGLGRELVTVDARGAETAAGTFAMAAIPHEGAGRAGGIAPGTARCVLVMAPRVCTGRHRVTAVPGGVFTGST